MNLATLEEFANLKEEIEQIAYRIVQDRFPDKGPVKSYVDDIEFWPSQRKVSISVQQYGALGWTDNEMIHLQYEDFVDPKYMLDIAEDSV